MITTMKKNKVIIAGSRNITNYKKVKRFIKKVEFNIDKIVSGMAKGVDKLGEKYAKENDIPIKQFPANWEEYGRTAGPIRNREMAEYATHLIAFWDGKSKGTKNMIDLAIKKGLYIICKTIKD